MLGVTIKIGRRNNTFYIEVYFIAISDSKYYIYVANLPSILVFSHCLKVYI